MDGVTILGTNELTHARWKEGDRDRASMACAYIRVKRKLRTPGKNCFSRAIKRFLDCRNARKVSRALLTVGRPFMMVGKYDRD